MDKETKDNMFEKRKIQLNLTKIHHGFTMLSCRVQGSYVEAEDPHITFMVASQNILNKKDVEGNFQTRKRKRYAFYGFLRYKSNVLSARGQLETELHTTAVKERREAPQNPKAEKKKKVSNGVSEALSTFKEEIRPSSDHISGKRVRPFQVFQKQMWRIVRQEMPEVNSKMIQKVITKKWQDKLKAERQIRNDPVPGITAEGLLRADQRGVVKTFGHRQKG
eukprot:Gb_40788 [translate_table: standard]